MNQSLISEECSAFSMKCCTGLCPTPTLDYLPPTTPHSTTPLSSSYQSSQATPHHSPHFTNCSHCYLEMQVHDVVLRSLGTHCHTGCRRGWVDKQAGVLSGSCATAAVYHKPAMVYLSVCLQASCCFLELDFLVGSSSSLVFSKPIYPNICMFFSLHQTMN